MKKTIKELAQKHNKKEKLIATLIASDIADGYSLSESVEMIDRFYNQKAGVTSGR